VNSGAGTSLKVWGGTDPAQSAGNFLVVPLHFFWLKVLVILVSAFVMVSTVWWFLVNCATHGAPRAQPFVKVGARAPVLHGIGATGRVSMPRYTVSRMVSFHCPAGCSPHVCTDINGQLSKPFSE